MDPTPLTAGQFFTILGGLVLGLTLPAALFLPVYFLVTRWWDRRALCRARAAWHAWRAARPEDPDDGLGCRFRLKQELWLEEQPAYIQAHLLRERLAEARRELRVREIMEAEGRGGRDGR
jgi:hypothetical protein